QRMCGVATLTARYVEAVAGTDARVVDTRKTTPGLRALERHAVRCGGGHNHRYSLSDAVMAKDNHLAVIDDIGAAIRRARAELPHTMHLEVEIDRLEQLDEVLAAGPDTIMLDNFSLDDLVEGVRRIGDRAIVEASGGITLDTIAAVAATGVDVISVGALTHSVRALDLGLDVVVAGSR
ncbi:MAG TPA: carboxylating nicotinate-nucleotide diphosphorylase, partial [Microlunatus sp.]|nr:carboxylating nicotinate-nucleotide diphosphorylase [Microlunatus sp.]